MDKEKQMFIKLHETNTPEIPMYVNYMLIESIYHSGENAIVFMVRRDIGIQCVESADSVIALIRTERRNG